MLTELTKLHFANNSDVICLSSRKLVFVSKRVFIKHLQGNCYFHAAKCFWVVKVISGCEKMSSERLWKRLLSIIMSVGRIKRSTNKLLFCTSRWHLQRKVVLEKVSKRIKIIFKLKLKLIKANYFQSKSSYDVISFWLFERMLKEKRARILLSETYKKHEEILKALFGRV